MARMRINPRWAERMREQLGRATNLIDPISFPPEVVSFNPGAQWLIASMADAGLIPKVENLGAGVKRIGVKESCCKTCGKPF